MKYTIKKLVSIFLSFVMIVSICIIPVYAEEQTGSTSSSGTVFATLAYSGEDTEVFYIPILDSISRGIYNLEVSLTGDKTTRTVSATVKNTMALGSSTIDIELALYSEKYPTNITSPVTGQSLPYDFSMTMSKVSEANRVVWNSSKRTAYAKYLGTDLTGYDVHHIIPREYGGTNDYSNLIPLTVSDHRTVTTWWVNY